jgi:diguanylate cyclase (GGDEF)-like protein
LPRPQAPALASVWVRRAAKLPPVALLGAAAALVAVVGLLDVATGPETAFSVFYLIPVAVAAVLPSRVAGVLVSVLAAAVWGYVEVTTGRPYSAAWIACYNAGVRLAFFLIVNELIHQARAAHLRLRTLSRMDPVTGVANARAFEEQASRVIADCRRHGRQFTLAYADLDRFKEVNDRFGRLVGDLALTAVARAMRDALRVTDTVARLGGDEFGILMPETGSEQAGVSLARVAGAAAAVGAPWGVGATFGAVTFAEPPGDAEGALHEADALMYEAKAAGRGRVMQSTWPQSRPTRPMKKGRA